MGFLGYVVFQLFQIIPQSSANLEEERVRIEAYQISELLVNDGGHPANWETQPLASINRIGLSDSTKNVVNYLSRAKINRLLDVICPSVTGYQDVKGKLDIKHEFSITFIEHTPLIDITRTCESSAPTNKKTSFVINRIVSIDGTAFGELVVEVWEI